MHRRTTSLALLGASLLASAALAGRATIIQVIDGDTVVAQLEETGTAEVVRLLGVDAPEEYRPERPKFKWAQKAREALAKVVLRKPVRLELAPERERDRFGRLLAYIHTEKGADVNAALISRGLALHFERYQHPRFDAYRRLQAEAERHRRGVFRKERRDLSTRTAPPDWATPTSEVPLQPPRRGAASAARPEGTGEEATEEEEKVRYFVSITDKVHREDCENDYVRRDIRAERGDFYDTYREADKAGSSNCKVCRPYLPR